MCKMGYSITFRQYVLWAGMLCGVLFAACNGEKREQKSSNDTSKTLAFYLPEVPVTLQSVDARLNFVVRHYWDKFDFTDTAYIHVPKITEQVLVDYLDLLVRVPSALADSCLANTMQQASEEGKMLSFFAEMLRTYLFDYESPFRNEILYEPVSRFLTESPLVDDVTKIRAKHDLKLISLNKIGEMASDFICTLPSGEQKRMYSIHSPYTLLLFYDPNCQECVAIVDILKTSVALNHLQVNKQLKVLAFYPDEDIAAWTKYQCKIPAEWINSYDKDLTVLSDELYDLKIMPVIYLLDKDKTVLLKTPALTHLEEYLSDIKDI